MLARKGRRVARQHKALRGIFGPPNMPTAAASWYVTLFRQLLDTPEMGTFIQQG